MSCNGLVRTALSFSRRLVVVNPFSSRNLLLLALPHPWDMLVLLENLLLLWRKEIEALLWWMMKPNSCLYIIIIIKSAAFLLVENLQMHHNWYLLKKVVLLMMTWQHFYSCAWFMVVSRQLTGCHGPLRLAKVWWTKPPHWAAPFGWPMGSPRAQIIERKAMLWLTDSRARVLLWGARFSCTMWRTKSRKFRGLGVVLILEIIPQGTIRFLILGGVEI